MEAYTEILRSRSRSHSAPHPSPAPRLVRALHLVDDDELGGVDPSGVAFRTRRPGIHFSPDPSAVHDLEYFPIRRTRDRKDEAVAPIRLQERQRSSGLGCFTS